MKKLDMHSPDLVAKNIDALAELFPNCLTEAADENGKLVRRIDFDLLRQELEGGLVEGPAERFRLDWPGKRQALLTANAPIAKTLRPDRESSVNFDGTRNIYIEGDNLDALKLLQENYLGKVKMIYIDPPYNTGHDFIYEDDFAEDIGEYFLRSNQKDEDGNRLTANTEANGRFHSDWLSMMYSRLKLARNLLRDDGAIFVSCDEVEQPRLRSIMDEVFGQGNFVADLVWAAGRKNDARLISISHEYIVCYAKDSEFLKKRNIVWRQKKKGLEDIYREYKTLQKIHGDNYQAITAALKLWYKNLSDGHPAKAHKHYTHVDKSGVYFPDNISWPGGGGPKYEVLHPRTQKPVSVPSRGWVTSDPKKMKQWIEEGKVQFGEDETSVPCFKSYLQDREYQTPYSVFYQDGRAASKRLRALFGGDIFDFPKDEFVLQELVEMLTQDGDIVMDFFAGSSTMAHSLFLQSALDGQNRRFILVQLPEETDEKSEAFKAGYKTIADIGRERIRRAGQEILQSQSSELGFEANHPVDIGFRAFKIDSSNMTEVHYTPDNTTQDKLAELVDNIKPGRTDEDLLFQVLLDWGLDLALPLEETTIAGSTVFAVDGNALAACFDDRVNEDLVTELARRKPPFLRVVFRDSSFQSDSDKINVAQIFKQLSPSTEVKVI